jgi:hypothetical protein
MFHLEVVSTELVRLYSAIAEVGACQTKQDISFTLKDTLSSNDTAFASCRSYDVRAQKTTKRDNSFAILSLN